LWHITWIKSTSLYDIIVLCRITGAMGSQYRFREENIIQNCHHMFLSLAYTTTGAESAYIRIIQKTEVLIVSMRWTEEQYTEYLRKNNKSPGQGLILKPTKIKYRD